MSCEGTACSNAVPVDAASLAAGLQRLRELAASTATLEDEFADWWDRVADKKKKVFTSAESDRAGNLIFRYMVARDMLWNMVATYAANYRGVSGTEEQTRALAIGYAAAVLLDARSARLVSLFIDQPRAIGKLNEVHLRYDVLANTFDALFFSVTSPANIEALRGVHQRVTDEVNDRGSLLAGIVRSDPAYASLLRDADRRFRAAEADVGHILKRKALLFPALANLLRQNRLAATTRKLTKQVSDNLYVAQGLLFNNVSDVKQPMSALVDFNPDQVRLIKSLLHPGDLIFTYTAGYMSNVFLPGKFKHGFTYIGTPEQRADLGLSAATIRDVPPGKRAKLEQDLGTGKLPSGYDADVIEAVAEGVILNSLEYLLKHHVNRMAVLRPRINVEERVQALGTVFLLLGGIYDFNFDFVDTSYLCCTEVIYRSFNRKGGIEFPLVQRMAVQTLAADDILRYYLDAEEPRFDFVLFAEEDPASPIHIGIVHTGASGAAHLRALMTGELLALP